MATDELDELDFNILHLLQQGARDQTPVDMADRLPVTDTTVRNRIEKMESMGVIEKYVPTINYENAGFPLRIQFMCTAPIDQRRELAERALHVPNIVRVDEMLTAKENIRPLAVTNNADEVDDIARDLLDLGLTIERECLMRYEHVRPFNHFGEQVEPPE